MTIKSSEILNKLQRVNYKAIKDYENKMDLLIDFVNEKMANRINIDNLIGNNPLNIMYDNHANHANFMVNIFKITDDEFFYKTLIWVYNTYKHHGFSYDYFKVELNQWIDGINKFLKPASAKLIIPIYQWMIDNHQIFIKESENLENEKLRIPEEFKEEYQVYFEGLIHGDFNSCLSAIKPKITGQDDLKILYNVIYTSLYNIGVLWQKGIISVTEEHLASSISTRIISYLYSEFIDLDKNKGKAVITAIPNEYHEIGSRIVADALEMDGWEIRHLGANTPLEDLINYLKSEKPLFIVLSVTMSFNIHNLIDTIEKIRSIPALKDIKILVGGKVFNDNPNLWKKTGADRFAKNEKAAITIARKWWMEVNK